MVADFSHFALWAAGLVTVAHGFTTPVGANPSGNAITKPGLNEIVPAGEPYIITWTPTTTECSTVDLVLLRGPSENVVPLYAIVENTANSGTFKWTPSTSLEPDTTHYGIQLICDQSGAYQYTTQFGISNPDYAGVSSSSAGVTSTRSVHLAYSSAAVSSSPSSSAVVTSSPASSSTPVKTYASSGFPVPGNSTIFHPTGTAFTHKPSSSAHKPTTRTTVLTQTIAPTANGTTSEPTAAQTSEPAPVQTNGAAIASAAFGLMGFAAAAVFAM